MLLAAGGGAAAGALIGTGVGIAAGVSVAETTTTLVAGEEIVRAGCGGDCSDEATSLVRDTLPKLEGSFAEAFDGEPVVRTLETGEKLYRAESATAAEAGHWFGTQATSSLARADRWWNLIKWGTDRTVLRTYEVVQNVSVYYGKVAGGRGTQILFPFDIEKIGEVVKRVGQSILK